MPTAVDPAQRERLERLGQRDGAAARRRHPARNARIAALLCSTAATAVVGMYLASADEAPASTAPTSTLPATRSPAPAASGAPSSTAATTVPPASTAGTGTRSTAAAPATTRPTAAAPTTTRPAAAPAAGGATGAALHDGTFTGPTAQTRWGPVQVVATVSGGKLSGIQVPVYPNDRGRSISINQQAVPILVREAVASQGARIDNVSGATYTTNGFRSSLQAALVASQQAG